MNLMIEPSNNDTATVRELVDRANALNDLRVRLHPHNRRDAFGLSIEELESLWQPLVELSWDQARLLREIVLELRTPTDHREKVRGIVRTVNAFYAFKHFNPKSSRDDGIQAAAQATNKDFDSVLNLMNRRGEPYRTIKRTAQQIIAGGHIGILVDPALGFRVVAAVDSSNPTDVHILEFDDPLVELLLARLGPSESEECRAQIELAKLGPRHYLESGDGAS